MFPTRARLIRISEMDRSDFGLSQDDFDTLVLAEGDHVKVTGLATDGYYDIELADGTKFDAISSYHLEGFVELHDVNHP